MSLTSRIADDPPQDMTVCSFCQAIDITTLPTFAGFSRKLWPHDLDDVASQSHHPTLKSLRVSAQTCPGCVILLDGLTDRSHQGPIPPGLSIKHVGSEEFATDWWDPSMDEKPVVVRGLGRDGFTPEKKQLCSTYQTIVSDTLSLPTRVLDLNVGDSKQASLVSGAGLTAKYVALSHCWGKAPIVRTTKDTFPLFTKLIDLDCLNKTFQDAIIVTKALDIRYIWIDSLCIIQDDAADWEREAASMAQVYSQAYLTIAASAASDGTQGLFRKVAEGASFELHTGHDQKLLNKGVLIGPYLLRFRRLVAAPLNTRAWTLQERILSPRTLHYASDQVHWECREMIISEAGGPPYGELLDDSGEDSFHTGWLGRISEELVPKSDVDKLKLAAEREGNGRSEYETWYGMVQAYTQRDLTKALDKLPALSGIAHAYSRQHDSEYIAGLWLEGIASGLLWYRRTSEPLRRPAEYCAPSWSWASVQGSVDFFSISAGTIWGDSIEIYDVTSRIEPDGLDPYGKVKFGELTLWGAIKPAVLKTIHEVDEYAGERLSTQMIFDTKSAIGSATLDFHTPDGDLACLLIASGYDSFSTRLKSNLVLLLRATGGKKNEFKRLGISVFLEKRDYVPDRTLRPTQSGDAKGEVQNDDPDEDYLENWFYDVELAKIKIV
ncbi:heterokaryon incompatibility protein-domain-containing protein [Xylariales sp. AK1849]|nr:heterokaryon incompatibility protein-domain-containing protein [Xylariales sp. AK1849]